MFLRAECARCTLALARPVPGLSGAPAQVAAICRGWIVQVGWSTRGRIVCNYWPARWLSAWLVGASGRWMGGDRWPHGRLRTTTAAQMKERRPRGLGGQLDAGCESES